MSRKARLGMGPSSTDPMMAHTLWLQRRSARQGSRRARWRSDRAPLGMLILLIGLLLLLWVFMPSDEVIERARDAEHHATLSQQQQSPLVGALAEP